jgi:hypothetical protein
MVKRKIYARPLIAEFLLDSELSLVMSSENNPDNPGGKDDPEPVSFPAQGSSTFKSEDTNKSFDEKNPFRE